MNVKDYVADHASHHTTESVAAITAKAAPPATVSLATIAGYPVSEIVLWATLIYTVLMIGHKLMQIYQDVKDRKGGR